MLYKLHVVFDGAVEFKKLRLQLSVKFIYLNDTLEWRKNIIHRERRIHWSLNFKEQYVKKSHHPYQIIIWILHCWELLFNDLLLDNGLLIVYSIAKIFIYTSSFDVLIYIDSVGYQVYIKLIWSFQCFTWCWIYIPRRVGL